MHQVLLHFNLVTQNDATREKSFWVFGPEHVIEIEFVMLSSTYQAGYSRVNMFKKYCYYTIYEIAALILASSTKGDSKSQSEGGRNSLKRLTSTHFLANFLGLYSQRVK